MTYGCRRSSTGWPRTANRGRAASHGHAHPTTVTGRVTARTGLCRVRAKAQTPRLILALGLTHARPGRLVQRHTRTGMHHPQERRGDGHPLRSRRPLPPARMDPHPRAVWADPFHKHQMFTEQRGRRGLLRQVRTGVLPQPRPSGPGYRRAHQRSRSLSSLVPRRTHQNPIRHEHLPTPARTKPHGIINTPTTQLNLFAPPPLLTSIWQNTNHILQCHSFRSVVS